jgi:uncharacterized protein
MAIVHDYPALLTSILGGYALPHHGYHGVVHWARVHENGLAVAAQNGADAEVVRLFALFHDARRVNEHRDPGHGQRGGELARSMRGSLVHLDNARFDLLYEACRLHTDGLTESDPTLQACWDADRLDLGRVGIRPTPNFLSAAAAELIPWAHARAAENFVPDTVLLGWGYSRA